METRLRFNEDTYTYDKYRPTYPKELFEVIFSYAKVNADSRLLEIGIGTGQATVPFLETGCILTAVELGDQLSVFTANKFKKYNNFNIVNNDFIYTPVKPNAFDLIYSATAFHWLPANTAYQKIKKCLTKGGTLALFWNHPFPNREHDLSNIANKRVYDKFYPSEHEPREFSEQDCEQYVRALKQHGFTDIQCKLFHRTRTLTTDAYIQLLNTYSDYRGLDPATKSAFETDMRKAIDGAGGNIHIYDTIDLYLARNLK